MKPPGLIYTFWKWVTKCSATVLNAIQGKANAEAEREKQKKEEGK